MAKTKPAPKSKVTWSFPWSKRQFILLGISIGVIVVGFLLLATGIGDRWDNPLAVNVAPVVLVIGYCVLVPWAIMAVDKKSEQS